MADLSAALADDSNDTGPTDIGAALSSDEASPRRSTYHEPTAAELKNLSDWNKQSKDLPWYQRAGQGLNDPVIGAGQLMQHVIPDAVLNAGRKLTDPLVNAVMGGAPQDTSNTTSADMDQLVRNREQKYQAERGAAGQEGMDWWRIGGNVANPVTWLAPESGPAAAGIRATMAAGAKMGAFQALLQPVTDSGSFLYDKSLQAAVGGAAGGLLAPALQGLGGAFRYAKEKLAPLFKGADEATQQAGAGKVVDDTLKAAGADPAKVDPNLYGAMKQEVADALKAGVDPEPHIILAKADAASLPVPISYMRSQLTRDPLQWRREMELAKINGAGEPLTQQLATQNRQLIENLNQLGADKAVQPFDASQKIIQHIEGVDAQAKAAVDQAYDAVRDSAGRPALMDHQAFQQAAKDGLGFELSEFVPATIMKQYNALATGQLPLTVQTAQTLDRVWSAEQRAAQGSAKLAIGKLRDALNNTPVNDALGQEAMAAYKAARELAAKRFAAIEANPAYKAVVDGVEPDKFFQKYVSGANVSEIASLKGMIGPENTTMLQNTLVGNLKRIALNRASDENGVFSQAAFNRALQDPVQMPRMAELFKDAPETLGQLYRVGRVAENVMKEPKASFTNTSNTAATGHNLIRDLADSKAGKSITGYLMDKITPAPIRVLKDVVNEQKGLQSARGAVDEAMNPGVTSEVLKPRAPSPKLRKLSDLAARTAGGGAAAYATNKRHE